MEIDLDKTIFKVGKKIYRVAWLESYAHKEPYSSHVEELFKPVFREIKELADES